MASAASIWSALYVSLCTASSKILGFGLLISVSPYTYLSIKHVLIGVITMFNQAELLLIHLFGAFL